MIAGTEVFTQLPRDTVDALVGGAFVVVYSAHRFNTPPTNRSSTTAGRYAAALVSFAGER